MSLNAGRAPINSRAELHDDSASMRCNQVSQMRLAVTCRVSWQIMDIRCDNNHKGSNIAKAAWSIQ